MAEINWRQISNQANQGNKLISEGIAGLQGSLTEAGQGFDALDQKQTDTNTANVMDSIRALSSTDQFNEAEANLAFGPDALKKYGTNINKDAIRTGFQAQREVAEQPEKLNIANLLANKDFDGAEEAIAGSGIRDKSKLNAAAIAGRRQEDTYNEGQIAKQRAENLRVAREGINKQLTQFAIDKSANTTKQRKVEQKYAKDFLLDDKATIDSLGNMVFKESDDRNKTASPAMRKVMQKHYDEYVKDNGVKIRTDKERKQELLQSIKAAGGAIPAGEVNAMVAQLDNFHQSYRKYQPETQAVYDASVKQATQTAAMARDINQREYQDKIDAMPTEVKVTPQMEKISFGDIKTQMEKDIDAEISKSKVDGLPTEFGENLDPSEREDIIEAVDETVNAKYPIGKNKSIAYPGWIVKEAYDVIGLNRFLVDDWGGLGEKASVKAFKNQLDLKMQEWLASEKNVDSRAVAYKQLTDKNIKANEGLLELTAKAKYNADVTDKKRPKNR